jgi:hypothetical protein
MDIEKLLAKGLQKGFGGGTARKRAKRGGFELESSHYETDSGDVYHDEWLADRVGGGQELVRIGDEKYTRVYAGGTISEEELHGMGITKRDVIGFLKAQILENGEKIRLTTDFGPVEDGDWSYIYRIVDIESDIPLITGKESVHYKGQLTFIHHFLLCPVE